MINSIQLAFWMTKAYKCKPDEGKNYIKPERTFNQVSYTKSPKIFSFFQLSILEEFPNELPSQPVSPVKHLQTLLETWFISQRLSPCSFHISSKGLSFLWYCKISQTINNTFNLQIERNQRWHVWLKTKQVQLKPVWERTCNRNSHVLPVFQHR